MSVACGSSCGELRATLAQDCGLDLAALVLTEVDDAGFHRTFNGETVLGEFSRAVSVTRFVAALLVK